MEARSNTDKTYSSIKSLLYKYNLVPRSARDEQEFLKELADILDL